MSDALASPPALGRMIRKRSFSASRQRASGLSQSNYYYEGDVSVMCRSLLSRSRYPNNSAPI